MEVNTRDQDCAVTACIGPCPRHADPAGAGPGAPPTMEASARRMLAVSCAYLCGGTLCQALPPSGRAA